MVSSIFVNIGPGNSLFPSGRRPLPAPLLSYQYGHSPSDNSTGNVQDIHDDVIKWKHFPRNWPFVRGNSPVPVNSPLKGQWRGTLMFSLICVWINGWANNRKVGNLSRNRGHYDVIAMQLLNHVWKSNIWNYSHISQLAMTMSFKASCVFHRANRQLR